MEWQIFPKTGTLLLEGDRNITGTVVRGFLCWVHEKVGCILALSTATFQFSRMDLPPPLKLPSSNFMLGQTNDGKLCIVHVHECNLSVWLRTANDGDVSDAQEVMMISLNLDRLPPSLHCLVAGGGVLHGRPRLPSPAAPSPSMSSMDILSEIPDLQPSQATRAKRRLESHEIILAGW